MQFMILSSLKIPMHYKCFLFHTIQKQQVPFKIMSLVPVSCGGIYWLS